MKRNKSFRLSNKNTIEAHKVRIAYHEAGHAIAIMLNNKDTQLPPLFFRINIHDAAHAPLSETETPPLMENYYSAEIEGGRFIEHLPDALNTFLNDLDQGKPHYAFFNALMADMLNLIIGPLAEAKHVAMNDGEVFNNQLISLDALHNYGGSADLKLLYAYLDCLADSRLDQDQLLTDLLIQAFDFISNVSHWSKITLLARHIVDQKTTTIDYNEITSLLSQPQDTLVAEQFPLNK
ncbi:MAG: hypothetical protein K9L22_11855 [Methylococcaceae bacterium]|nr:hypothetical protein [Methylococcaceae bacterium]